MPTPQSEVLKIVYDAVTIGGPLLQSVLTAIAGHDEAPEELKAAATSAKAGLRAEMDDLRADADAARRRIAERGGQPGDPTPGA